MKFWWKYQQARLLPCTHVLSLETAIIKWYNSQMNEGEIIESQGSAGIRTRAPRLHVGFYSHIKLNGQQSCVPLLRCSLKFLDSVSKKTAR